MSEWIKTAKPMDLIVCVNDDPNFYPGNGKMDGLKAGEIYTIRQIAPWAHRIDGGPLVVCIWLVEIIRGILPVDGEEVPYSAERFRPVSPTATDLFRRLTAPQPRINVKDLIE